MEHLNIDGMAIAPGVLDTIVSLAACEVDGVVSVGDPTTSGLMNLISGGKPSTQGIEIEVGEDDRLHIVVRLHVKSGQVLPDLAASVRKAVVDAVATQVGAQVESVDIFIDGIQFDN